VSLLEIAYLLGNSEMVYANQPEEGATSIVQFGTLLAKFGSVV
jgi:hypothetical protein